jgi:hypothetical protein
MAMTTVLTQSGSVATKARAYRVAVDPRGGLESIGEAFAVAVPSAVTTEIPWLNRL